jgi:glycosyl transferase family 25
MSGDDASLASLSKVVDKVVVITLPSATERQHRIASLFASLNLPFEFHFGTDCRPTTVGDLAASGLYDAEARLSLGRPDLTPGEIGCALSHRDVAQSVASGSHERVLVLEDDVRVIPGSLERLRDDITAMPQEWSLAYFGHSPMNLSTPAIVRLKLLTYYPLAFLFGRTDKNPATIRRIYRRPLNSRWMFAGWFNDAHAYAIDRQAAEYLASLQRRIWLEADLALNRLVRFSGLTAITQRVTLFQQGDDVPSQIGARPSWK